MDVKKNIYSLCINKYDTQIALVENQGIFENGQESVVRIYDVGRRRDNEDDQVSVFDWLLMWGWTFFFISEFLKNFCSSRSRVPTPAKIKQERGEKRE